jgi:hypothetical protein
MSTASEHVTEIIAPEVTVAEEVPMVRQERWEELRRLWGPRAGADRRVGAAV